MTNNTKNVIQKGDFRILIGNSNKIHNAHRINADIKIFEKFCEGRYCEHLPRITSRISGMHSIPHHITSAKALENAWGVEIPKPALKLRKLMMNASQYSTQLMHYLAITTPDLKTIYYGDPSIPEVLQVLNKFTKYDVSNLQMMDFGQRLVAELGGKVIHPISVIIGGIEKPMKESSRDKFLKQINRQIELTEQLVKDGVKVIEDNWNIITKVDEVPANNFGITNNGTHGLYEGILRIVDKDGKKTDYEIKDYKSALETNNMTRSNSLAMINAADNMATPLAEEELKIFKDKNGIVSNNLFMVQWARLIELLESIECIKDLLEDSDICNSNCKTLDINPNEAEGIGITSTSRGLLIHHLWSDSEGICKKINIFDENIHIKDIENTYNIISKQINKI